MATNVQWITEDLGPQARIVIWAHNEHVSLTQGAMGGRLRRAVGGDVLVVGSAFGQGSFLALPPRGSNPQARAPEIYRVGPPPPDSLEATLAAAGIEQFVLDLRGAGAAVAGWFDAVRPMRMFGARVQELSRLYPIVPSREFHAIAFVERISPAHRLVPPGSAE